MKLGIILKEKQEGMKKTVILDLAPLYGVTFKALMDGDSGLFLKLMPTNDKARSKGVLYEVHYYAPDKKKKEAKAEPDDFGTEETKEVDSVEEPE